MPTKTIVLNFLNRVNSCILKLNFRLLSKTLSVFLSFLISNFISENILSNFFDKLLNDLSLKYFDLM